MAHRKGYCVVGLKHGRDAWLRQIPKKGFFNKGPAQQEYRCTNFYSGPTILDNGPPSGLVIFRLGAWPQGSVGQWSQSSLHLARAIFWGMDAILTSLNDGP
jgi:hypothetical protein